MAKQFSSVEVKNKLKTDTIAEKTLNHGVTVGGVTLKSGGATLSGLNVSSGAAVDYVLKCDNASTGHAAWAPIAAAATPADDSPIVKNATDPTKRVRIVASSLTTNTTRTLTMPDIDVNLPNQDTGTTSTPTFAGLRVPTSAQVGYVLKCENATSGNATWQAESGSGSSGLPLAGVYYVATNGSDTTGTGSATSPYATITKALSMITLPASPTAEDEAKTYVVQVAPGSYSETIAKNVYGLHITLHACGGLVQLGEHDITITNPTGALYGNWASFRLTGDAHGQWAVTGVVSLGGRTNYTFDDATFNDAGTGSVIQMSHHLGSLDLRRCVVNGTISETNFQFGDATKLIAEGTRFGGTVQVYTYESLNGCSLVNGMQWYTVSPTKPRGLIECEVAGTFTSMSAAHYLWMDGVTLRSFKANGCVLGGVTGVRTIDAPNLLAMDTELIAGSPYTVSDTSVASELVVTPSGQTYEVTLPAINLGMKRMITVRNQSTDQSVILRGKGTDHILTSSLTQLTLAPD